MIRKFEIRDLRDVLEIERESFPKTPYSISVLLYLSRYYRFMVYDEDRILGYVVYDTTNGHVISIAVRAESRRAGVGSELMAAALKECGSLWLEVRVSNEVAKSFYEKLGFRVTGRIEGYYGDEDALIMTKD
jgi:ribosomal-protein-alanine N-acetyltransferase